MFNVNLSREPVHPALLTDRQRSVVGLLTQGYTLKQTADMLKLSQKTIEYHSMCARRKIGVMDTATLTQWALAVQLIQPVFNAALMKPLSALTMAFQPSRKRRIRRANDKYGEVVHSMGRL